MTARNWSSRLTASLGAMLNVRPDEAPLLLFPVLLFFLKGICDVFYATSASTLFLKEFGNFSLPKVYIASAALVTISGLAYSFLATRMPAMTLLRITLGFSVVTIGVFHFALAYAGSRWWTMGLMIWREVPYTLLNVAFWAQAGLLFNVRQSKRLFPLIAAGDIASAAISGFAIPFIVGRIGPLHLLFFAEFSIALCLIVAAYGGLARRGPSGPATTPEEVSADARPLSKLVRERYVALFMGISVVSFVIYFFADYNFYGVVNNRYGQAESLAAFLGVFYAVLNGLNLLINGALAGRVLRRYGTYAGLLALPICVGAGTIAAIGLSAFGMTTAIFWAIISTKLLDEMLRGAFLIPTFRILCQPLPDRERLRVQSVRDSIVEPVAIGLSGVVLLVLTRASFGTMQLLWVLLLVIAVFVTLSLFLRRQYIVVLGHALPGRTTAEDAAENAYFEEAGALMRGLDSLHPDQVVRSFNTIQRVNPTAAKLLLAQVLKHASPEVRIFGLRQICESRETRAADLVRRLIETEDSPRVKSEALRTLSFLSALHKK